MGDSPTTHNSLSANQNISSGDYRLYIQGDGNLVLRDTATDESLFSIGTNGTYVRFQGDGNFLLRDTGGAAIDNLLLHCLPTGILPWSVVNKNLTHL